VKESVSAHFRQHGQEMEDSIRIKVEDVQLRLLDRFFNNIQVNYAQRIAALEEAARVNNETLQQIQGYSARAEEDLRRLTAGIRGLIGEFNARESEPAAIRDRTAA
jgi:uncharacterized coiled-coil protein SlyX